MPMAPPFLLLPIYCIGYGCCAAVGDRILTKIYMGLILLESFILGKALHYGSYAEAIAGNDALTVRLAQAILVVVSAVEAVSFIWQIVTERDRA